MKFHTLVAVILSASSVLWAGTAGAASLLTNGTFDTDISGWDESGIGATWVSGAANLGQPGTPGSSTLSQDFILTNPNVTGSFDYTWEVSAPAIEDIFSVVLEYTTSVGTDTVALFTQGSNSGSFGTPVTQLFSAAPGAFTDFVAGTATLIFKLVENNSLTGTRVRLDNVSLSEVPLPAAAWLFVSALGGLVVVKRKSLKA